MDLPHKHRIRVRVCLYLHSLGADVEGIEESTIQDGDREIAVRFRTGDYVALWTTSTDRVTFYDGQARPLGVVQA